MIKNSVLFAAFEKRFLREDKIDLAAKFRLIDGLYHQARAFGVFPPKSPLDGIEVDIRVAKLVNSVRSVN